MTDLCSFRALAGAETGLLKNVCWPEDRPEGVAVNVNAHYLDPKEGAKSRRAAEVTCLDWAAPHAGHGQMQVAMVGTRQGSVSKFHVDKQEFLGVFDASREGGTDCLVAASLPQPEILVTAYKSGCVTVWPADKGGEESKSFNTIDTQVLRSGKLKHGIEAFQGNEEERTKHLATLKTGRTLTKMRTCTANSTLVATGGKENDLQLWNLSVQKPVFIAKNVKHDNLELRVPVWVSDIAFPDALTDQMVVAAHRHGAIRLYDLRTSAQRRPAKEVSWPDEAITAISPTLNINQVLVGTTEGRLALFDFRSEHKGMRGLVRRYKGCVGSVRSIAAARDENLFATVGLDRYLRVYKIDSKNAVSKMYLKSRLNSVLVM